MTDDVIGAKEAAHMLGCSRATVARMVRDGRLKGVLVGKSFAIPRDSVVLLALDRYEPVDAPFEQAGA